MIKLLEDEFSDIRMFLGAALQLTSKPKHKVLMRRDFGVSWNKINLIYEDLISSTSMEYKKVLELKTFLTKVIAELESNEEKMKNTEKTFGISLSQLKDALVRLHAKERITKA